MREQGIDGNGQKWGGAELCIVVCGQQPTGKRNCKMIG